MARHLHYGHHNARSSDTLNLGRCAACGTANPTVPGEGLAQTCAGCGTSLQRDESTVKASAFLPRDSKTRCKGRRKYDIKRQ